MSHNFLDQYAKFLNAAKNDGFEIWSFSNFIGADKNNLPERLIVLRHDIHHRDINGGYRMLDIERDIYGENISTSFVQYDFKPIGKNEYRIEQQDAWQSDYRTYIKKGIDTNVDIQPHVSPLSFHYQGNEPYLSQSEEFDYEAEYSKNYVMDILKDEEGNFIAPRLRVIGEDTLGLFSCVDSIIRTIPLHAKQWKKEFNYDVEGYSAHGESAITPFIKYNANRLIDDFRIVEANVYQYSANSLSIANSLSYVSDNYDEAKDLERFFDKVSVEKENTGHRFQVLVHPDKWYRE